MSSKSSPLSAAKSGEGRKQSAAGHARGTNGKNGNGRHANGGGTAARKAAGRVEAGAEEVLQGQPPIETLIGLSRESSPRELDKKTLLGALLAFRKGDFTARLPIELDGMDGKIADTFNDVIE